MARGSGGDTEDEWKQVGCVVPGATLPELSLATLGQQRARVISGTEKNEADIRGGRPVSVPKAQIKSRTEFNRRSRAKSIVSKFGNLRVM